MAAAKTLLSLTAAGARVAQDDDALRRIIPADRTRAYDMRVVIEVLVDPGSFTELRQGFGTGMITGFMRLNGRAIGLVANNPLHLGGAIDAEAADKGARFLQLCDAWGLPVLTLCDTPGFMVGPQVEETGQVAHVSRLFLAGAHFQQPMATIILRKGYGLGAMAMAGLIGRISARPGPQAKSARWASKGRCDWATGITWPRSATPWPSRPNSSVWLTTCWRGAKRSMWRVFWNSTRS